ncbi:MAG: zinc ribbon domain-containing protein [Bacillota bacterium]|nr:zinc ribbon domain-containing protein [Bacillota bacterium]
MAKFCQTCGKSLDDNAQFCDGCGAAQATGQTPTGAPNAANTAGSPGQGAAGAPPQGAAEVFSPEDIEKNKGMAALAYILFFLPLVACPDSRFGRYHANQGLLILIGAVGGGIALAIISTILGLISYYLLFISSLLYVVLYVGLTVLIVMGIINAVNGKAKPLPLVGHIKIIK